MIPTKEQRLTEPRRKEIFLALLQTALVSVDSRELVAQRFAISEEHLARIEREGIAACWPPLD